MTQVPRFPSLPEEFQRRVRAGGKELIRLAASMTVTPVFGAPPPAAFNTACGLLIEHRSRLALLTAEHVISHWEKLLRSDSEVGMQIERLLFGNPSVTHRDQHRDLIALSLGPVDQNQLDSLPYQPAAWPPVTPRPGDSVYFVGYPKVLRQDEATGPRFADFSAVVPVTSVTEERITCQFKRENWLSFGYGESLPTHTVLGGMSGAPVFLMSDLHYPLIGIISQFSEAFDLMYVARLDGLPSLDDLVG